MAVPIIGTGITWYERKDYPRILQIMEDVDFFPRSYDRWKECFEEAVEYAIRQGATPIRVPIDPEKFHAWCVLRGKNINSHARHEFASDPANWPNKN